MHLIKRHFCLIVMIGHFMASSIPAFAADQTAVTRGPLDDYCLRVTNQIRQTCATKFAWDKVVSASIALDENGRIVETNKDAKPEESKAASILKTLNGLPKPPPDTKRPFWLTVHTSHKQELITAFMRDIDFGQYMINLQTRIKHHWHPIKEASSRRVTVVFKVMKDGKIDGLKIATSSSNPEGDQAALAAVNEAQCFDSLPDGSPPSVKIEFNFDYNVFNGGYRRGGVGSKVPDVKYTPSAGAAVCLKNGNTAMSAKNYSLAVQYFQKAIDLGS